MLEITISSQVLAANEVLSVKVLTAGKVDDIESNGKSKRVKPKTRKLESRKLSKSQNLSKFKKPSTLEYAFIFLRLAFTDIQIEKNDSLRCSIQNSQCKALALIQVSRFGDLSSTAISINQSENVKQNYQILYRLSLAMINITLSVLFGIRSFKFGYSLCSEAPPGQVKDLFLLDAFPNQLSSSYVIIFKPQSMELLMFCLVTNLLVARTKQMQLQMFCFVKLRKRPLGFHGSKPHSSKPHAFEPYVFVSCSHVSELRSCAFEIHISKPCSHVFEPCFHVSEHYFLTLTFSSLALSSLSFSGLAFIFSSLTF